MFAVFNISIIYVNKPFQILTNETSGVFFICHYQDTLQTGSIIKLYIVIKQSKKIDQHGK